MVYMLDEKKQDICKFRHSRLGARQQISSRDILASTQASTRHSAGHHLLGA